MTQEVDLEAQHASLQTLGENDKIRIVRQLSYHRLQLGLELQSTHTLNAAGGNSIDAAEKSHKTAASSVVIDNSLAAQKAIILEMKRACETDLEAQIAPLLSTKDSMQTKSQTMSKLIRILQVLKRFRSFGNASPTNKSPSLSRMSSENRATYESITESSTPKETDREIMETSATTTTSSTVNFTTALLQSGDGYTGIGLQDLQCTHISAIVNNKNLAALNDFGGITGVADALNTDLDNGITPGEQNQVTETSPQIQPSPHHHYIHFIRKSFNNAYVYLLSLTATLSLGFGIKEEGFQDGWSDGVFIAIIIILHVVLNSTRRYKQEKARRKSAMQEAQKEKKVEAHVIRGGQEYFVTDLVCGDIILLRKGYQIPADGIFIAGQGLEMDDGSKSTDYDKNPFLFHGVRVINGSARMIVTAVGANTKWSKMKSEGKFSSSDKYRLEANVDKVATYINITGLVITIIIFIASFARRYVLRKLDSESGFVSDSKGEPTAVRIILSTFEKILTEPKGSNRSLIAFLSVSFMGIMDVIPYVVSVAIIYWNQKTFTGYGAHQDPYVSLKMASSTAICTGTIGGLAKHGMEFHSLHVGLEVINESSMISPNVLQEMCNGISTLASSDVSDSCVMKATLLSWGEKRLGMRNTISHTDRLKCRGHNPKVEPCGELIQNGTKRHLYWKGPVIDILNMCSDYYDREGKKHRMEDNRMLFEEANTNLLAKNIMTIAFASAESTSLQELEDTNLTLVGIIGLKPTNFENKKLAIEACRSGGVKTILVASDDVSELELLAIQCGLLTDPYSGGVLKGEDFQKLSPCERMEKLDTIRVMGNSSAEHKQLIVKCLREKGEVVLVIGQRTDDAPAIRGADIGIAAGTWSSDSAREVSNVTIWEWDFTLVIDMINCGKCIRGNIQKFIQLELILNSASILINLIGTVSLGDSPITAIQFFCLNLLMAIPGGLAILTGPSTSNLIGAPPINPREPLETKFMIRNVVLQTIYQVSILVVLQHRGPAILGSIHGVGDSMIFNSLVLCQFFNLLNARELQKKNFLAGISQNLWFWIGLGGFMGFHIIFVVIDKTLMDGTSLDWKLWAVCFLIGIFSWPIDYMGKLVSGFMNQDWLKRCLIQFVGKFKYFLIIGSHSEYESMGVVGSNPSESRSNLNHPLMSRNPTTIPLEIKA